MMRKFGLFIAGALACVPVHLSADYCGANNNCAPSCNYNDCCDIDWCGGWNIYADYIYWTPRKCDTDYAITGVNTSNAINGNVACVDPNYTSGFKVGITKYFDCFDLGVRYTYLRPSDGDSVAGLAANGTGIIPTRVGPTDVGYTGNTALFARANYNVDLDIVQLEVGRAWNNNNGDCCGGCMRSFAGFKYVRLDQTLTANYTGPATTSAPIVDSSAYTAVSNFNAYGLYMGIQGARSICDLLGCGDFGLFGSVSLGALVADSTRTTTAYNYNSVSGVTTGNPINLGGCDGAVLLGNIDIEAGIYVMPEFSCLCGTWSIFVGYEFHSFLNTPNFITDYRTSASANVLSSNCDNTSFDGLFVRLGYCF